MKKLTNYGKMLICMALVLVLSIGATIGITMTYFGDSKSGSVEIKIGASIYFATEGGVGVAVQDGTTAIVPTQSVEVDTTLKIMSSSDTNVTKGVLKVIPSLSEDLAGASLTLADGETYDVYLGGSTTKSDSAVMVVANNALYLVKATDTSTLYEITPNTSGLEVKFSVPVTFSKDINNDLSGQSCTITMKGIVLQSNISGVAQTITAFEPYFTQMAGGTTPSGGSVYTTETVGDKEYIIFGSYPQTIKSSSVTVGTTTDENGYYTGSDGEKYAKVTANMYGTSDQYKASDGTTMSTGTDYYFKVEPLKWRVLSNDGSTALIVCDQAITAMAYQPNYKYSSDEYYATDDSGNIITDNGSKVYANNYKWSKLRSFLNGDFYDKAFNTSEQAIIKTTDVDNSASSTGSTSNSYACENTDDKIFALSYSEAKNTAYGFTNSESSDSNRTWSGSDYAKANYLWVSSSNYNSYVWLRSPDYTSSNDAWYVYYVGSLLSDRVDSAYYGVVPALQLSL